MSKFKDRLDREWTLDVTMGSADQVEQDLGIDLLKWMQDGKGADNRTVFKIVGSLCADQIAARELTLRDFAAGFDGEALERAGLALTDALLFFSLPSKPAKAASAKLRQTYEAEMVKAAARIGAQDFSSSDGASPAPADSTPAPSPCGS